eukprot:6475879-Amphidinium_carterae.2
MVVYTVAAWAYPQTSEARTESVDQGQASTLQDIEYSLTPKKEHKLIPCERLCQQVCGIIRLVQRGLRRYLLLSELVKLEEQHTSHEKTLRTSGCEFLPCENDNMDLRSWSKYPTPSLEVNSI